METSGHLSESTEFRSNIMHLESNPITRSKVLLKIFLCDLHRATPAKTEVTLRGKKKSLNYLRPEHVLGMTHNFLFE